MVQSPPLEFGTPLKIANCVFKQQIHSKQQLHYCAKCCFEALTSIKLWLRYPWLEVSIGDLATNLIHGSQNSCKISCPETSLAQEIWSLHSMPSFFSQPASHLSNWAPVSHWSLGSVLSTFLPSFLAAHSHAILLRWTISSHDKAWQFVLTMKLSHDPITILVDLQQFLEAHTTPPWSKSLQIAERTEVWLKLIQSVHAHLWRLIWLQHISGACDANTPMKISRASVSESIYFHVMKGHPCFPSFPKPFVDDSHHFAAWNNPMHDFKLGGQ